MMGLGYLGLEDMEKAKMFLDKTVESDINRQGANTNCKLKEDFDKQSFTLLINQ
jgi:Tfp pilus assembly protein PilF